MKTYYTTKVYTSCFLILVFFSSLTVTFAQTKNNSVQKEVGLSESLLNNGRVFQIDANFGATAGIAEMLLQSHDGSIRLLPELPDAWKYGKIIKAEIKSTLGGICRIDSFNELKWMRNGNFKKQEERIRIFYIKPQKPKHL